MARKRRDPESLLDAKKYYRFLLWEATGGTLGTSPEAKNSINENITFAEKRGLLDSIIKIAAGDKKDQEDEGEDGFFDVMKKRKAKEDAGKTPKRARAGREPASDAASPTDDSAPNSSDASARGSESDETEAYKNDWRN